MAADRASHRSGCCAALVLVLQLTACSDAPPSWDTLIAQRIVDQYPSYTVTPASEGVLSVARPGQPVVTVAVAPIAQFCQRGPKDCNYAIDQMLLELAVPLR